MNDLPTNINRYLKGEIDIDSTPAGQPGSAGGQ